MRRPTMTLLLLFCLAAPAAWADISALPPPLASPTPAAPGLLCRAAIGENSAEIRGEFAG